MSRLLVSSLFVALAAATASAATWQYSYNFAGGGSPPIGPSSLGGATASLAVISSLATPTVFGAGNGVFNNNASLPNNTFVPGVAAVDNGPNTGLWSFTGGTTGTTFDLVYSLVPNLPTWTNVRMVNFAWTYASWDTGTPGKEVSYVFLNGGIPFDSSILNPTSRTIGHGPNIPNPGDPATPDFYTTSTGQSNTVVAQTLAPGVNTFTYRMTLQANTSIYFQTRFSVLGDALINPVPELDSKVMLLVAGLGIGFFIRRRLRATVA